MSGSRSLPPRRWGFVAVAALAMGAIGTYQFVWSTVRVPLGTRLGASETSLGTVFTLYLVCQSLSQFPAGWVRDRYGPRIPMLVGTPLVAVGYAWTAVAGSLTSVYVAYALGGVGAGIVYTVATNTAVKWFDERRGLATGIVMAAYSALSFLLIPVVRGSLAADFEGTLTALALGLAAVSILGLVVLRDPPGATADPGHGSGGSDPGETVSGETTGSDGPGPDDGYAWYETVRTWQFWLLYAVFVAVNGVGLMLIGKVVSYAEHLALPAAVATASASVVAASDGLGVIVVGGLSDRFGEVRTVAVSLVMTGVAVAATVPLGTAGLAWPFVAAAGAAAFFRSPPFSVFPGLVGEYYGVTHSSENYALLYSAKIPGSIFGGTVASGLVVSIGWTDSFLVAAVGIVLAGLGTFLLRPPGRTTARNGAG